MEQARFRELLTRELPHLLRQDPGLRVLLWEMLRPYFADRKETEGRFEALLEEFRREREAWFKKWEENERRWRESQKRWEENTRQWRENERRWQENERRWRENERRWRENERRWQENERRWRENERRWEENQEMLRRLMEEDKRLDRRIDSTIGALGARWGLQAEESFRNALAGIMKDVAPDVEVVRVVEWDEAGEVFGRPDQIELDLIIKNGDLIIGEIKSSMSKSDMYMLERKARFCEKKRGRKARRLIAISPMVEDAAKEVAKKLGIEVYTFADEAAEALNNDPQETP